MTVALPMAGTIAWIAAALTVGVLAVYELSLARAQRRHPAQVARSAHAALRQDWLDALDAHPGSEVLAVQTLRNSVMSATMTASTAVLGLMGTVTLAAPSLSASFGAPLPHFTPLLAMELLLLVLLFASLVASVMAVRDYHHAGFVAGMPVGSDARVRWRHTGVAYLRRAGLLYGWGLRQLVLVAPVVGYLLHPLAGPLAAVAVVLVLSVFDRAEGPAAER